MDLQVFFSWLMWNLPAADFVQLIMSEMWWGCSSRGFILQHGDTTWLNPPNAPSQVGPPGYAQIVPVCRQESGSSEMKETPPIPSSLDGGRERWR